MIIKTTVPFIVNSWVLFPRPDSNRALLWLRCLPIKEVQDNQEPLPHERDLAMHHQAPI